MSEENFLFDDNGFVFTAEDGSTFDFSTEQIERLVVAIQNLENPHLLEKRIHGTPVWTQSVAETFEDQIGSILDDFPIVQTRSLVVSGFTGDNTHLNGVYFQAGNPQGSVAKSSWRQISPTTFGEITREDTAAGTEDDFSIINYFWQIIDGTDNDPSAGDRVTNSLDRSDSNPKIFQPYELNWPSAITVIGVETLISQNHHIISKAVKELNKKLYQFGLNSRLKGTTDAGFYPDDVGVFASDIGSIGTVDFLETQDRNILLLENGHKLELQQDD
tara:strand:+ start:168 stop:989 length:822 start_codon:yes stop_codon:yes gene_type:complete